MTWGELKARMAAIGAEDGDVLEHVRLDLGDTELTATRYELCFDEYGPAHHLLVNGRSRPRDMIRRGGACQT